MRGPVPGAWLCSPETLPSCSINSNITEQNFGRILLAFWPTFHLVYVTRMPWARSRWRRRRRHRWTWLRSFPQIEEFDRGFILRKWMRITSASWLALGCTTPDKLMVHKMMAFEQFEKFAKGRLSFIIHYSLLLKIQETFHWIHFHISLAIVLLKTGFILKNLMCVFQWLTIFTSC